MFAELYITKSYNYYITYYMYIVSKYNNNYNTVVDYVLTKFIL